MKKTDILLFALLAFSCGKKPEPVPEDPHLSHTVWVRQNSGTTANLYSVHFPSRDTGYAAGAGFRNPDYTGPYGVILKTTDGGTSWTILNTPDPARFNAVHFLDASTGYAVGNKILKTIDGGKTWTDQPNPVPDCYLSSLFFTDRNTGYAAGVKDFEILYGGTPVMIRTLDGGNHWTVCYTGDNSYCSSGLTTVFFKDANTGFSGEQDLLIKTTDGGNTWTNIMSSFPGGIVVTDGIFADNNTGYIIGGKILKTTDGGTTWTEQLVPQAYWGAYYSIRFITANKVCMAGGTVLIRNGQFVKYMGVIAETTDGGTTWKGQIFENTGELESVFFTDANNGYAVGDSGVILKTTGK